MSKLKKSIWAIGTVMAAATLLNVLIHIPKNLLAEESHTPSELQKILIDNDLVQLILDRPSAYKIIKMDSPPRIVIDLIETVNSWKYSSYELKKNPFVNKIRAAQFGEAPQKIARIVLDMKKEYDYNAKWNDSTLEISIDKDSLVEEEGDIADWNSTEAMQTTSKYTELSAAPEIDLDREKLIQTEPVEEIKNNSTPMPTPTAPKILQPIPAEKLTSSSEPSSLFGHRLISLDFYDVDIHDLFDILSDKAGVNIVFGTKVSGKTSVQLKDVPFKDAIDTILALTNLKMIVLGKNILQVMTADELDEYRTKAISVTKVFPINYARASDVNTQLTSILSTLGGKGKTLVDERTNSIIVTDTPEGIESTSRLITDLDKPTPQVMIEAKIVQVSLGKSLDLGISWGVAYSDQKGNQMFTLGASKANEEDATTLGGSNGAGLMTRSPLNPSGSSGLEQTGAGFTPSAGLGLAFGFVKDALKLNAQLSALQQKNKSKLLSNPKVATLNNQSALIKSEVSEPYITKEVSFSQGQSVTAEKVNTSKSGISLSVTPTINADGRITMKIVPDVTSSQPTSIGVPKTTSQQANTTVIVKNGETFVIGGLISELESDENSFVPLLGKIPILGHLFKKTSKNKQRGELLVFVTPHIIPF